MLPGTTLKLTLIIFTVEFYQNIYCFTMVAFEKNPVRQITGVFILFFFTFQTGYSQPNRPMPTQDVNDSLIWQEANNFISVFNSGDTAAMLQLLPPDFMLQWLHDNFLGKKNLCQVMKDTAVHRSFMLKLEKNAGTIIRFSDDKTAASFNISVSFLAPDIAAVLEKHHNYGLCIFYFQNSNDRWRIKTVHLDIHCSLCDN